MNSPASNKPKRTEEEILDQLAKLLVDDFLAKKTEGKLPKPVKRGKKSVRK